MDHNPHCNQDRSNREDSFRLEGYRLSTGKRIVVLLINYIPFLQAIALAVTLLYPWSGWLWRVAFVLLGLYLVPPLLARLILALHRPSGGKIAIGSIGFFIWWLLFNLQAIFCRFPALEEMLRLVPALYSTWLRIWGSRLGGLIYWAPGTLILDRSFLELGRNVMFGAGVRLNPHVIIRNGQGEMELLLAPIVIGDNATIGGYSLLTAGTRIAAGEATRAFLISPPFSRWKDGRREHD